MSAAGSRTASPRAAPKADPQVGKTLAEGGKTSRSPPDSSSVIGKLKWAAPSILTLGALVCGLSAVRFAAEGNFDWSVTFILFACILDGLDGHVARALGTSSDIGFELDSLCDLANFGVMPPLIVYFWVKSLPESECFSKACSFDHSVNWCSCCFYAACCALRLARFNVAGKSEEMDKQLPDEKSPQAQYFHNLRKPKLYFQGVPAPVAAAYALSPMMLRLSNLPSRFGNVGELGAWAIGRKGTAIAIFCTGLLMVAPFRTLSSKMLKSHGNDTHLHAKSTLRYILKLAAGVAFLACAWFYIFETVVALVLIHLISIPLGIYLFRTFAANHDKNS